VADTSRKARGFGGDEDDQLFAGDGADVVVHADDLDSHGEQYLCLAIMLFHISHGDGHFTFMGELDRIAHEVDENLTDTPRVCKHDSGHGGQYAAGEFQSRSDLPEASSGRPELPYFQWFTMDREFESLPRHWMANENRTLHCCWT
jgi:hypothetical protein